MKRVFLAVQISVLIVAVGYGQERVRARDLGVPFDGQPGPLNAITDVRGVEIGHTTLISGSGKLQPGKGPVRTGVTAVLPKGKVASSRVFAGWFSQNGNGEMTGTTWIEESGILEGPILITNTHSVGVVRDAVIQLRIAGAPVGREIPGNLVWSREEGSIIVVVATDAPLLPHQLKRLARRATMGVARMGSTSGNGSGDIFIAFSTANSEVESRTGVASVKMIPNDQLDPMFDAVVQATEEAIVNALVAAKTMEGRDGHVVQALPHDRLREVLKKYGRLVE